MLAIGWQSTITKPVFYGNDGETFNTKVFYVKEFILQRSDDESIYNQLFYEMKKDLFEEEKEIFSEDLKMKISK